MTLHVLTPEHIGFMAQCFMAGGLDKHSAYQRAYADMEVAQALYEPTFFVGPTAENPRYYMGAYTDVNGRAHLTVGSVDLKSAPTYRDAMDWLDYLLNELELKLIEANVWVEDLKKEWFLRAIGFKKGGVLPDKLDIPGRGTQSALVMYIRPIDFYGVTRDTFHDTIKKYKAHRDRLRKERAG
jgi:hypothetical protein